MEPQIGQSLDSQHSHKLLGLDTMNQDSVHEDSKCLHCQEKPKLLSMLQERPATR